MIHTRFIGVSVHKKQHLVERHVRIAKDHVRIFVHPHPARERIHRPALIQIPLTENDSLRQPLSDPVSGRLESLRTTENQHTATLRLRRFRLFPPEQTRDSFPQTDRSTNQPRHPSPRSRIMLPIENKHRIIKSMQVFFVGISRVFTLLMKYTRGNIIIFITADYFSVGHIIVFTLHKKRLVEQSYPIERLVTQEHERS